MARCRTVKSCRSVGNWLAAVALATGAWATGGMNMPTVRADLKGPDATERQVAMTVRLLLGRDHLTEHAIDDEISHRALDTFVKRLDPAKLYFYQSDIERFQQQRDKLDEAFKKNDITFAYDVFKVFVERVDERLKQIDELLAEQPDFTLQEEYITDFDHIEFPKDSAEARDRWRRRLKYDLLLLKTEDKTGEEAVSRLKRRYANFARRVHRWKDDDLVETYLTAITSSFDPHTTYMSRSNYENFLIQMRLNLEGIGAALKMEDGLTVVDRVIPGGAAEKSGQLKPEDQIVSVGEGENGEMVDVIDANLNDVVELIRGKAGTVVRLGVKPAGSNETKTVSITRAKIELKDSEAQSKVFEIGKKPDGTPFRVGVIDLPSFYMDMNAFSQGQSNYKSTTRDVDQILEKFRSEKVDVVVLDLRRNGGGSLTEAINLTGLFIDRGPVVQVKDGDERVQTYDDSRGGTSWSGPLVVLTSKFSASASEILAGTIQDYGRGIIIGDSSTHGKGTVQSLLDLGSQLFPGVANTPNLGALKITIQKFYRPSGQSTQKRGVLSDVVLPSFTDHTDYGEADLDYAIEFDTVPAATFGKMDLVNDELVRKLTHKSQERQTGSKEFQDLEQDIKKYVAQKERKAVSLNEEEFLRVRKEFDADKEDEKQIEEQIESSEGIRRDFYLDEVMNIAVDYLGLLGGNSGALNTAATQKAAPSAN